MQTLAALLLLSVPTAPATVAPTASTAPVGDQLRLVAREGLETRYAFTETTDLRMTRLRSVTNGRSLVRSGFTPRYRQHTARRWRDRVIQAGEGRALEILRTIDRSAEQLTIEALERGKEVTGRAVAASEVEGESVRFTWSEDRGAYSAELADADDAAGSPAWLGDLDADVTGGAFLPPEDLERPGPGSRWSVDPDALASILAPGGRLAGLYGALEGAEDPDLLTLYGPLSASRIADEVEGEATAKWRETLEEGDRRFAVLDVEFDVELGATPTDWIQEQARPNALALVGQGTREAKVDAQLKGTATLVWDIGEGRLLDVRLRAESVFHVLLEYAFSFGGTDVDGRYELDLEGETSIDLEARR